MVDNLLKKSLDLLLKRQTNILSAAFVIMATVIFSLILGVVRQRLLISIFGAFDTLGIYLYSSLIPEFIFQSTITAALSSAFIPVYSNYIAKDKQPEADKTASVLLSISIVFFCLLTIVLSIFAPVILQIFNLGHQFTAEQMNLMANLMRIIMLGQILFIIGMFFSALLQSYNHFFVPGFALGLYNLGIIIGIITLSSSFGIYAPAVGVIIGSFIFILAQIPLVKKVGFSYRPSFSFMQSEGVKKILKLMWPRTISFLIFYFGTLFIASLITFLEHPGRLRVIFDYSQTLAFAPVTLFGQSIAQAAFPVLSREKDHPEEFLKTFTTSFNQILYLVLPIAVLILVLRIPIIRLIYGAPKLDWQATVLTGHTLAYFSISIFAQCLLALVLRAYYALHDTKIPFIVGAISTFAMVGIAYIFIILMKSMSVCIILFFFHYCTPKGVELLAVAYSLASLLQLALLLILLNRRIPLFSQTSLFSSAIKIFICSFFTFFALYIPFRFLDQLVFDTTRTVNLILLTGVSSLAGLSLYLLLSWIFKVKEAYTYILLFKRMGDWREILGKSDEVIEGTKF